MVISDGQFLDLLGPRAQNLYSKVLDFNPAISSEKYDSVSKLLKIFEMEFLYLQNGNDNFFVIVVKRLKIVPYIRPYSYSQ
jgi:hypothetical protein